MYYVLTGVHLLKDNLVQGMMLDTTWNLLSNYIVSIPIVILMSSKFELNVLVLKYFLYLIYRSINNVKQNRMLI